MKELWRSWGEQVAKARVEEGLSQRKLASLVGVSPSAINHLEHGDNGTSDSLRIKLAKQLHTQVAALFPYPEGEA